MKTFVGYLRGQKKTFKKAVIAELYPDSVIFTRHHSGYIKGFVHSIVPGKGIKVRWPHIAPSHPPILEKLDHLFQMVED
jgi:hypothetical protein